MYFYSSVKETKRVKATKKKVNKKKRRELKTKKRVQEGGFHQSWQQEGGLKANSRRERDGPNPPKQEGGLKATSRREGDFTNLTPQEGGLKATSRREGDFTNLTPQEGGFPCTFLYCRMPSEYYDSFSKKIYDKIFRSTFSLSENNPDHKAYADAIEGFVKTYLHSVYYKMGYFLRKKIKDHKDIIETAICTEFIDMILSQVPDLGLYNLKKECESIDSSGDARTTVKYNSTTPVSADSISKHFGEVLEAEKSVCTNASSYISSYGRSYTEEEVINRRNDFIFNSADGKNVRQTQNFVICALSSNYTSSISCTASGNEGCIDVVFFKKSNSTDVLDKTLKETDFLYLENKNRLLRRYLESTDKSTKKKFTEFFKNSGLTKDTYAYACVKYIQYRLRMSEHKNKFKWSFKKGSDRGY